MNTFNSVITKLCRQNGLPHITPHGLRHQAATIMLEQGISLAKISAILGHSSVNTTFNYYLEVMDENSKIVDFLNEKFVSEGDDDNV